MQEMTDRLTGSLCWCCSNAYDGCAWSREGRAVKGWDAVRQDLPPQTKGGGPVKSFLVRRCPRFRLESRFEEEFGRLHEAVSACG